MTGAEKLPEGPRPKVAARPRMTHGYGYPFLEGWQRKVKNRDEIIKEMLAVLKELEWKPKKESFPFEVCNTCFSYRPDHHDDCKHATAISKAEVVLA